MSKLYTYDGASWVEIVGSAGANGADGVDGKTLLNGAVDPTTEGVDGDFYINTVANTIFGPKAAGVWGTGTSIVGADGADGLTVSVNSVTQVAGDISLTQDNIPDGTTNKAYTATEQTKLSGIEALADVTDATNVAAAGAIMDGDITGNGLMTRTGAGTYTNRTITGTSNQVTVTNGDGVSGNPTLSLPQDIHTGATPQFTGLTTTGNISPTTDSARTLGTSSLYWSNTYTDRLYLNSTAYLDGGTAGAIGLSGILNIGTSLGGYKLNISAAIAGGGYEGLRIIDQNYIATSHAALDFYNINASYNASIARIYTEIGASGVNPKLFIDVANGSKALTNRLAIDKDGLVGIGTTAPTHTLTLPSTSTGIALYNTADQTTNYERLRVYWSSNEIRIGNSNAGTGATRAINISAFDNATLALRLNASSSIGIVQAIYTGATAGSITSIVNGTISASSGTQYLHSIAPTINQSSTAGYTALLINPTETATGSGAKNLIDAQVGGVSKFKVTNGGMPELGVTGEGIVMKSPDGTRYKVTVANGGTIAVAAA